MKNLLLLLVLIGFSCNQENLLTPEEVFGDFNKRYMVIPLNGWELQQIIEGFDSRYYSYYQKTGDTVYEFSFDIFEVNDSSINDIGYVIDFFHKSIIVGDSIKHDIRKGDFSIAYSENQNDEEKVFYNGIFYYMYLYPKEFLGLGYSKHQYNYIIDNIDSLACIKGNNMVFPDILNNDHLKPLH